VNTTVYIYFETFIANIVLINDNNCLIVQIDCLQTIASCVQVGVQRCLLPSPVYCQLKEICLAGACGHTLQHAGERLREDLICY
jgi:hypothetical protein